MKLKHLKTSSLVAIAVLFMLTTYLFAFNRARRRARVPAMTFILPPITVATRTINNQVQSFCFAPQGQKLLLGDYYYRLYLANLEDASVHRLSGSGVKSLRFGTLSWNSNGSRIHSLDDSGARWRTTQDGTWRVIGLMDNIIGPPEVGHDSVQTALSATGRFMAFSEADAHVWRRIRVNSANGQPLWAAGLQKPEEFEPSAGGGVCGLLFSPDEKQIVVVTRAYTYAPKWSVTIYRVADGRRMAVFAIAPLEFRCYSTSGTEPLSIAFSPNGQLLAFVGVEGVGLFSTRNGALITTLPQCAQNRNHGMDRPPIAFSPNGQLLAVTYGKAIEVWNVERRELRQIFFPYSRHLAFSLDSKWLASDISQNGSTGQVNIWEVGSLE